MGMNLIKTVVTATDLPETSVLKELESIIDQHDFSADDLSLEELRIVMVDYLQSVFLELCEEHDHSA